MAARWNPRMRSLRARCSSIGSWQVCPAMRQPLSVSASPPAHPTPTGRSLVSNRDIARLAAQPMLPLTLADLIRHGKPPLPTTSLLSTANFARSRIPIRLAHRLQAMQNLPFIVVSNPSINLIYETYQQSLAALLPYCDRDITTIEEEIRFTEIMADLVQTHSNTIPSLASGFLQSRKYITPEAVTKFLDGHLRARIGTRLIAEQHIAMHLASQQMDYVSEPDNNAVSTPESTYIGVIDTAVSPATVIQYCDSIVGEICELKYGIRPSIIINGQIEARLAYVSTHLEYIMTEVLKNAYRATIEKGSQAEPIEITIAAVAPTDSEAESGTIEPVSSKSSVTIRIRDRGGGIDPDNLARIWDYSFTTFDPDVIIPSASMSGMQASQAGIPGAMNAGIAAAGSSIAGLGYGLPLGRAYAEHFGGHIAIQSMWGWGTDVYVKLKGLD